VKKLRRWSLTAAKLAVTGLLCWYVLSRIDLRATGMVLKQAGWLWLIPAWVFFVLSKMVSSDRLNLYFGAIGIHLSRWANLRLYLLGMFYNLFLPGGIGGDGYKVYWLHQRTQVSAKSLTFAVLLDRINGMLAIVALSLLSLLLLPLPLWVKWAAPLSVPIGYGLYVFAIKHFFKEFISLSHITSLYSVLVQGLQCVSVFCIIRALGIHGQDAGLLVLFMISSVVAVLPFTIGGLGARELVFVTGSPLLLLDPNSSVSISILFYLITVTGSLPGLVYHFKTSWILDEKNDS